MYKFTQKGHLIKKNWQTTKKKKHKKAKRKKRKKKKSREEKQCTGKAHVQVQIFLSIKQPNFLYLVFSSFEGENFLVWLKRKHLDHTIYFPSSLSNQTHSEISFFLIFFLKFSIHPILLPNKHTLKHNIRLLILIGSREMTTV